MKPEPEPLTVITASADTPEQEPCPDCDGPLVLLTGYRVCDNAPIACVRCLGCGRTIPITVH